MPAQYSWLLLFLIDTAYGNSITSNETHHAGWMPEPRGRGTLGILFPCFITIGLCVWTAVHIDIVPRPTTTRTTVCHFEWLLLAVLFPDMTSSQAVDQYWAAKVIKACVEETRAKKAGWCIDSDNDTCDHEPICNTEFPLSAAFFIAMGGFVIDPGPINALPLALTPDGFAYHYKNGLISEEYLNLADLLEDKSKASGLSKLIVCSQTLWFLVQCIGRAATKLSVTLIELHTIFHVISAVYMYSYWWHKPFCILHPVKICFDNPCLTEHVYSNFIVDKSKLPVNTLYQRASNQMAEPKICFSRPSESATAFTPIIKGEIQPTTETDIEIQQIAPESGLLTKEPQSVILPRSRLIQNRHHDSFNTYRKRWERMKFIYFKRHDASARELLSRPFQTNNYWRSTFWFFDKVCPPYVVPTDAPELSNGSYEYDESYFDYFGNLGSVEEEEGPLKEYYTSVSRFSRVWKEFSTLSFLILFGAIHLLGYKSYFPTDIEARLWFYSSFVPQCVLIATAILSEVFSNQKVFSISLESLLLKPTYFLILIARAFLVIESFISIRDLPVEAFETVTWSNYWPHF